MGSRFYIRLIFKLSLLIFVCCVFVNCSAEKPPAQKIIFVKVPPVYNEKLSREENFWLYQKFLFPQIEIPNPIPQGIPNDDSLLFVEISENGEIELNSQAMGNTSETEKLRRRLAGIFSEREKMGAYEPASRKIVKAVGIRVSRSVKYGDFMKVVEAVEQSGAEPIVLLFNDEMKPKPKVVL